MEDLKFEPFWRNKKRYRKYTNKYDKHIKTKKTTIGKYLNSISSYTEKEQIEFLKKNKIPLENWIISYFKNRTTYTRKMNIYKVKCTKVNKKLEYRVPYYDQYSKNHDMWIYKRYLECYIKERDTHIQWALDKQLCKEAFEEINNRFEERKKRLILYDNYTKYHTKYIEYQSYEFEWEIVGESMVSDPNRLWSHKPIIINKRQYEYFYKKYKQLEKKAILEKIKAVDYHNKFFKRELKKIKELENKLNIERHGFDSKTSFHGTNQ